MANLIITKPLLALRGVLIFPGMIANLDVGREKSIAAIDAAEGTDKQIILVGQKQPEQENVAADDLYEWGVLANIKQRLQLPNGAVRLLVEGLERVHVLNTVEVHENEQDFFVGEVEVVPADDAVDAEAEGLRRLLLDAFEQWVLLTKKVNPDTVQSLKSRTDLSKVPDIIVGYLPLSLTEKEELLEMAPLKLRLRKLYEILVREQEIADVAKNISEQVHQQVEQNQKEYYLREQIKAISKELGENEDVQAEIADYKEQMSKLKMPQNVAEKINKELGRLAKMPPMTPEGAVIRTYIDSLLALPWGKFTKDNFDIDKAQDVLDKDHYGLKKVKERILEYLAVRALSKSTRGPILCLVGPPGVGKTTLAQIIANKLETPFYTLSAVTSGVKDVREVIDRAKSNRFFSQGSPILFIDEIHRFSKSQQDSLLGAVEQGTVTLIGATTENPSFEVIRPLLSRCQLYVLKSLEKDDLLELLQRAITTDHILKERTIELKETTAMLRYSGGDARKLLNILDLVVSSEAGDPVVITDEMVTERLQQNPLAYDKDGEMHYDIISAFIKSIRGSDPDGAIYWLARMVEAGEDPAFIARRLVISASEDVGLANPNALLIANACFDAVMKVGWPEGRIPLAEATVYLATSPKSNSAYMAINNALELVRQTGNLPVPLHLRNAPTKLMKQLGYGDNYKYAHDYPGHFVKQQFLPDELKDRRLWEAQDNAAEQKHAERMRALWGEDKFRKS